MLIWRENFVSNRISGCVGPFTVLGMDAYNKIAYLQDVVNSNARPFNIMQLKLYHTPTDISHTLCYEKEQGFQNFSSGTDDEVSLTEVLDQSDPFQALRRFFWPKGLRYAVSLREEPSKLLQ